MIYFGQFTDIEGKDYSVTIGDKNQVDNTSIAEGLVVNPSVMPYQVDLPSGSIEATSFSNPIGLYDNQIHIPAPTTSMLSDNESAITLNKTKPNIRIDVTAVKTSVTSMGEISLVRESVSSNYINIIYKWNTYPAELYNLPSTLYAWDILIAGVDFPDSNEYAWVEVSLSYEGFTYQGVTYCEAWSHTYKISNNSFVLPYFYSLTGSSGQEWEYPATWTNVESTDVSVCDADESKLYFDEVGETVITFDQGFCMVHVIELEYETITLAGNPITIETKSEKGLLSPIKGSSATIRILSAEPTWDLFSSEIHDNACKIEDEDGIIYYGYVTPNTYSQPFIGLDEIEINCIDPISALVKDYVSDISSIAEYSNILDLVKNILSEVTGHCMPFVIPQYFVDNEISIHGNVALIEDFSYKEVLEEICRSFGLSLVVHNDIVYFLDYAALKNNPALQYKKVAYEGGVWNSESTLLSNSIALDDAQYGQNDTNITLQETYRNITIEQIETDNEAVNIITSEDDNKTYDIVDNKHPYDFFAASWKNDVYKWWIQFFDSEKYAQNSHHFGISMSFGNAMRDNRFVWGTNMPFTPNTSFDSKGGAWYCIHPYKPNSTKINYFCSISDECNNPATDQPYNREIAFVNNAQAIYPTDPQDESTRKQQYWDENGMGGNGWIVEASTPVRYQASKGTDYAYLDPKSDSWIESILFSSFGQDTSSTGPDYRLHDVPYLSMITLASDQVSIEAAKWMVIDGEIMSTSMLPDVFASSGKGGKDYMRRSQDSIANLNGLDCFIIFETSDNHYFLLKQERVYDNDAPKFLIRSSWEEITEATYDLLCNGSNSYESATTYWQVQNLNKIPINLNEEGLQFQNTKYSFSNDAEYWVNDSARGFTIPLPWMIDTDAPVVNNPRGANHADENFYSSTSNVTSWLSDTNPSTISRVGVLKVVAMGGAFGGMNRATTGADSHCFRYNYVFLSNVKFTPSNLIDYLDYNADEGSAKDLARLFTYNYNKKDYSKFEDVEIYYHSNNEYTEGNGNNVILENGLAITEAPQYITNALGTNKQTLEEALLQRYYTHYSQPRVKLEQTYNVESILPYAHAIYDGLITDSNGVNKKLMLDAQTRNLKYCSTNVTWIEHGDNIGKVIPEHKKRKR